MLKFINWNGRKNIGKFDAKQAFLEDYFFSKIRFSIGDYWLKLSILTHLWFLTKFVNKFFFNKILFLLTNFPSKFLFLTKYSIKIPFLTKLFNKVSFF